MLKTNFDKITLKDVEGNMSLKIAYVKLLRKCVKYEDMITDLYNENYRLQQVLNKIGVYEKKK
jgi:hypothetical protein